jgi:glycosyltransferase involved in cell wall biosynthesis
LLFEYTKHADLGISVEENKGLNYFYALPNKLFDYIQAEIPVLVSPFPEMKNIVNTYKIGDCIENHHPQHIAEKIKEMLTNEEQIPKWKKNLTFASKELCWELEEKKIFELISNAENFGN